MGIRKRVEEIVQKYILHRVKFDMPSFKRENLMRWWPT